MAATVAQRLIERLRREGLEIPDGCQAQRTRASRNELANGGWSWVIMLPSGYMIASPATMNSVAGAARLVIDEGGDIIVDVA